MRVSNKDLEHGNIIQMVNPIFMTFQLFLKLEDFGKRMKQMCVVETCRSLRFSHC